MQLRCEEWGIVWTGIKLQEETSVRFQKTSSNIIDKKSPILRSPFLATDLFGPSLVLEANARCRHQVKSFAEVGQQDLRLNAGNNPAYI